MKKVLLTGGTGLARLFLILVVVGVACFLAPSSFAQGSSYSLTFIGLPTGGSISLSDYIGLDRKLKPNVAGQKLRIDAPSSLVTRKVRLSIVVSATGSTLSKCNGIIATAQTVAFDITGAGRELGASDFTGSSGIGIQNSTENQDCIDALADKITEGVASIPNGIYRIDATLNDAATGDALASGYHEITLESASTTEAVLNLTSPANGEQVPQSASVVFAFDNSIPGRLLAFEHSNLSQSPDDATRDLNSSLKILDVEVTSRGTNQVVATSPGNALRPWMANKKVSWLFLGQQPGSTETRKSPVWSFMIVPSDPTYGQLARALANAPDPISSTYSNLIASGHLLSYSASNPVYIQGGPNGTRQTLDVSELLRILANLQGTSVQVSVVER
jgi:hypothetical protein